MTYSGNLICLDSGFEVALGGAFTAEINPCTAFTSASNTSITSTNAPISTSKSTERGLQIHQSSNSKSTYIHCHIPTAGLVEVYIQKDKQERIKTIFSGHTEAGFTRFRMNNDELSGEYELVLKTEKGTLKQALTL